MDAAARNAGFGHIKERLVENAGVGTDDNANNRIIKIDVDVVPAQDSEVEEPMASGESEDETYYPGEEDNDDDDESLASLENPALDDNYESSDDEEEEPQQEAPRRSTRIRTNITRLNPQMRGQVHADVRDVQAMQAEIQDRLPEEPILLRKDEHE